MADKNDQGSSSSRPDKGKAPMVSEDETPSASAPMNDAAVVPTVPEPAPVVEQPLPVVLHQDLNEVPPAPVFVCPCCPRIFLSEKALFGHQRSHPERTWRGANPPPKFSRTEFSDVAHLLDWSGVGATANHNGAPVGVAKQGGESSGVANQGGAPGGAVAENPGDANSEGGNQGGDNADGENVDLSEFKVPDLNKIPPKE